MEIRPNEPPRVFEVGDPPIELRHCADAELAPEEQITFTAPTGSEFDVVRKSWGYYGTPSLNRRLPAHGLHPALTMSRGAMYLLLVESGRQDEFHAYLDAQGMEFICWLDSEAAVNDAASRLGGDR